MVILLPALCALLYTGQSVFNKLYSLNYTGPDETITPVFSVIYGLFITLATFLFSGLTFCPSATTIYLGLACGVVLFLYNLSLINASRTGPYAFQSMMMLSGETIIPLIFSTIWWGDTLGILSLIGIAVVLVAFVVFNCKGFRFANVKRGYFFWVALLFCANGCYGTLMDSQQRIFAGGQRGEMIEISFLFSALISAVYLLITQKNHLTAAFSMGKKNWGAVFLSSACAAGAINLLMIALRLVPVSVLFTAISGGVLVGCSVLGVLVFHEKLEKQMIWGLVIALIGIVLLSIA